MNARQKWVVGVGLALFLLTVVCPAQKGRGFGFYSLLDEASAGAVDWSLQGLAWAALAATVAALCLLLAGPRQR